MEKLHDNPRVSSRQISWWKLNMLAEVAARNYGSSNKSKSSNCYHPQLSVKSTKKTDHKPRVSVSSPNHKPNSLIQPKNPNPDERYPSSSSSCVTASKKRRSVNFSGKEEEIRKRKKRKKVRRCLDHLLPTPQTTVPEWLVDVMAREENGYDPKLIIARTLYKSDLDKAQARLSMPLKQVVSLDFLTEEETRILHEQAVTKTRSNGLSVVLVDPLLNKHKVDLRKWKMSGSWNYVFVDGWNDVVAKNKFEVDDVFLVWSFRSGEGKLCFALIPGGECSHGNSPPA